MFRPPHCPGWDEVHNLELRESVAETRREPRGPLEPALALNTPASWQPIRHATRVGEEGEHLVDWNADVVDERVANRAHRDSGRIRLQSLSWNGYRPGHHGPTVDRTKVGEGASPVECPFERPRPLDHGSSDHPRRT